jgi:hypothetical protein
MIFRYLAVTWIGETRVRHGGATAASLAEKLGAICLRLKAKTPASRGLRSNPSMCFLFGMSLL